MKIGGSSQGAAWYGFALVLLRCCCRSQSWRHLHKTPRWDARIYDSIPADSFCVRLQCKRFDQQERIYVKVMPSKPVLGWSDAFSFFWRCSIQWLPRYEASCKGTCKEGCRKACQGLLDRLSDASKNGRINNNNSSCLANLHFQKYIDSLVIRDLALYTIESILDLGNVQPKIDNNSTVLNPTCEFISVCIKISTAKQRQRSLQTTPYEVMLNHHQSRHLSVPQLRVTLARRCNWWSCCC